MDTDPEHPEKGPGDIVGEFTECETWIKAITGASPIPQFIIDGDHRVLFWNEALEKYSGLKAGDILGTKNHWKAFYSHERPCLADLLLDGLEDRIPECYHGKYKKSLFLEDAYEATDFFPRMRESGTWLNFTAALIRDGNGIVIGAVETMEDVTGRKQAEEKLQKSEKKYRSVFELANDAIFLHTLTSGESPGLIIEANEVASRMLGYSREELFTMGPPDIVPPELHSQLIEIIRQAKTKKSFIFETIFLSKDGTRIPVEASAHLVDFDGKKIWISHIRDITERKRMENALKDSEDRFRELFNSMKSGVAIYRAVDNGKDFEFVDFNHGSEILENLDKKDVIGKRVTEIFPGIRDFGLLAVFQSVWRTGVPKNHPVSHYRDNRIESWRENFVYRLPSREIVAIYEDATESKRAEEALRESEKKYRNIVENISDVILTINPEGIITYINPVIEELYGYTPEEIKGNRFSKYIHPDDLPIATEGFQKRLKGEFVENTLRIIAKDGSERFVRTIPTPIIHNGGVTGFNYIMTDFTERIRAEEALRESEKKYRNLVENINDVIFTLNSDGIITYMSPVVGKIYGYDPEKVTGQRFDSFIHPDDLPMVKELFSHYLKGEQASTDVYVRAIAGDGSIRFVRANTTPINDRDSIKELNFIITDLTDRKKAEEALATINNKLNMLSSITRHDILNAINAVRGYLEMSEDFVDDPKLRKYIEKEEEAVDAIQHQIEFTRFYQDIGMKEPGWQTVCEIMHSAVESLDTGGINISCFMNGPEIFCDPLIEKVFYNLIDNSIRHGEHVTEISLSYRTEEDGLIISYRDNGAGISDKAREKLFQRGFGKNTGLGLFLSREILSITGIEISEKGREGEGVNFEIAVPKGSYRFKEDPQ